MCVEISSDDSFTMTPIEKNVSVKFDTQLSDGIVATVITIFLKWLGPFFIIFVTKVEGH